MKLFWPHRHFGSVLLFACLAGFAWVAKADDHPSAHIQNFALSHCSAGESICFRARSELAFLDTSGTAMSGEAATLEVLIGSKVTESYQCASFRFDVLTSFFICDNRERGTVSLTVDAEGARFFLRKRRA